MGQVEELLQGILGSYDATKASIDEAINRDVSNPEIIENLLQKLSDKHGKLEGVSLLALKNNALLSYLNNLALITLSHITRLEEENEISEEDRLKLIKQSIVQRVTLEKGIKPLEKKLNYQLDKMVRSYTRMENDDKNIESKIKQRENDKEDNSDSESESNTESESESDSDEDEINYKPDAVALAKMTTEKSKSKSKSKDKDLAKEKYKPPRVSAIAPPKLMKDPDQKEKNTRQQKLQSMEEYLREQSDTPTVETSIGSTIVDHGRGGVKTQHDRNKEKRIQDYEESNFTRLPQSQTKKSVQQRQRDMQNHFGGEDWSIFNNNREVSSDTSRKRKPTSSWDRAKKRRNQ